MYSTKIIALLYSCFQNEEKLVAILVISSFERVSTSAFREVFQIRL